MGKVIKRLASRSISQTTLYDRRVVLECAETFHLHWRNVRLEMSHANFRSFIAMLQRAMEAWKHHGSPEAATYLELGSMTVEKPVCYPDEFKIELCEYPCAAESGQEHSGCHHEPDYVHLHYRDLRVEMSLQDFGTFASVVTQAYRTLQAEYQPTLAELFSILNDHNLLYVVLPHEGYLPENVEVGPHCELDLLIHPLHVEAFDRLWHATPNHQEPYRSQRKVPLRDRAGNTTFILVNLRTCNDGYYPVDFAYQLLERRICENVYYGLAARERFLALLYHVVHHKGVMTGMYEERLCQIARQGGFTFSATHHNSFSLAVQILNEHGIVPAVPRDISVCPKLPYLYGPSTVLRSRWLTELNGKEYLSRVYRVETENGTRIVKQATDELASREHWFLSRLNSDYFPRSFRATQEQGYSVCEIEYIEGTILYKIEELLPNWTLEQAQQFVMGCLDILEELQQAGFTHRDICLENMILRNGKPVLIDFGWATSTDYPSPATDSLGGQSRPPEGSFCDVYSMGVVIASICKYFPEYQHLADVMTANVAQRVRDLTVLRTLLKSETAFELYKPYALQRASELIAQGKHEAAEQIVKRMLRHCPHDGEALRMAAELADSRNDIGEADYYWKKAIRQNASSDVLFQYGQFLIKSHRLAEAFECFKQALDAEPQHAMSHNELGVLFFQQGDVEGALHHLQRAVDLDPQNLTHLKNLADLKMASGDFQDALHLYQRILELDPQDVETLTALANLSFSLERLDDAEFFFQEILKHDPENERAQTMIAEVRMTRFLSGEAAQQKVTEDSTIDPSNRTENEKQNSDGADNTAVTISERYERVPCPGCGRSEATQIRKSAEIVQCQGCGLVYLRTRLTKSEREKFYQSYADDGSHLHLPRSDEELHSTPLRRKYFLDEILQFTQPGGTLLDVGCGWGAFLLEARDRGFEPRGIEITRKAATYAADTLQLPVSTTQFLETSFQPDSLAVVTMLHVLEHLPETREVVERVFSILKPGGLFCGIVPNIASLCSIKQGDGWRWLDPNYHYVHFSPKTLRDLLQRAGFCIERVYTTGGDFTRETIRAIARRTAGLSTEQEIDRYLAEVEELGYGEEIRFVARKPLAGELAAAREVDHEHPRRPTGRWKVERSDGLLASIIVPVYNRVEFTRRCLAAIYRTVPAELPYEVIVVDNASSGGTQEFIDEERKNNPRLRSIRNSRNLLFARACNIGAEAARGKYLVFLNNHTEPQPGWLEAGVGRLQQQTDIGIVGGKMLYPDRRVQHCGIEFVSNAHPKYALWPLPRFRRAAADDPRVNLPEALPAVTGACLFIPRRLFRSVGGFSEDYERYFEAPDLCLKVKKRGKRVFYEPSCVVIQYEGASSSDRATIDTLNEKAARVFFQRWQSEIQKLQFDTYVAARDGKFEFLSPEILPEGNSDTLTQEMLNAGAVRLATFFQGIGPFYAHFGGAGDAALLLSTFYDREPEQTIVSVANSPAALQSFFNAFPKLKRIIFIPFPRFDHSHLLLRRLFAQLGNCKGMGATPTQNYFEEWNSTLDIFEKYRIKKRPRWAKAYTSPKLQPIQVTLQPKGSLKGMVGSKKNVIDRAVWSQLLATLNQRGITPIILGTPDEAREYPAEGTCIEKRSYSFDEQLRLIASSDIFIGADSWGKTFAALCGVPAIVFQALRGADLASWKDPSDYVFIDPWEEITVVRSVADAESKIQELLGGRALERSMRETRKTVCARPEPETFCLVRYEGMGDVVMTFPVARVLKEHHPSCRVLLATHPRYEQLARACPWIDGTVPDVPCGESSRVYDLNAARFGLADIHQIDAYLEEFNLTAGSAKKEILLNVPHESDARVCELMKHYVEPVLERRDERSRIVLLHAARGDVNRTWPAERWAALGRMILEEGHVVILVGNNSSDPNRGTANLACQEAINLVGKLTPLEFVALCRRAHLLVSTDSGPIQLAGASDIAIAGIYTVVRGRHRLPYRHGQPMWNAIAIEPDCPYAGCYRTMKDEYFFASWRERLASGAVQPSQMFAEWCVVESKYQCLEKLSPAAVWERCKKLVHSVDEHIVEAMVEATLI